MKYNNFEDLPIWVDARGLVNAIYMLLASNQKLYRDFELSSQLKRCAYSVMLNIAEGFERSSNKEFANFLNIAKGSAGEVRCILYILLDNEFINRSEFDIYFSKVKVLSAHIANFRKYLISTHNK